MFDKNLHQVIGQGQVDLNAYRLVVAMKKTSHNSWIVDKWFERDGNTVREEEGFSADSDVDLLAKLGRLVDQCLVKAGPLLTLIVSFNTAEDNVMAVLESNMRHYSDHRGSLEQLQR